MKISTDSLAQIARFADVDDRAETVLHQIHARLMRQDSELLANLIVGGHDGGSRFPPFRVLDESVTQHVADRHLRIFDPPIMRGVNSNNMLGRFAQSAALAAHERDRL